MIGLGADPRLLFPVYYHMSKRYCRWFAGLTIGLFLSGLFHPVLAQSAVTDPPIRSLEIVEKRHWLLPTSVFVQAGMAHYTSMMVAGLTWNWGWQRETRFGELTGYWEVSAGRWSVDQDDYQGSAWVTQVGVTPVLRITPETFGGKWFAELGIGFNYLLPVYQSRKKRFSTAFNFGDHVAIGRRFGTQGRQEVALRLQHFSNAGIREPNPGENFVQLRYAFHF